jgi:hypothetical protein
MIQVETQKETNTAQALFISEVGAALDRACEEIDSTCEGVNRDFAQEVILAASKYGMNIEEVGKVLADFGRNEADIATGPGLRLPSLDVIDVLRSAYETLLGEDKTNQIYKCIKDAEKKV